MLKVKAFIHRLFAPKNHASVHDAQHINPQHVSSSALTVVHTLQEHGFSAFIVGGAVRDLLLNIQPKDFDVATNATPDQVKSLFRKSRIIGKRFQIVHVNFYHGRDVEIIEVTTFRGDHSDESKNNKNQPILSKAGQILHDNSWGTHAQDAARRDFSMNGLYYDPHSNTIHDFYQGIQDIKKRILKMIGDPELRYREDPVRMLRLARLWSKTGFALDEATRAPIKDLAPLLANVPKARLLDELRKMLVSGHAQDCIEKLHQLELANHTLPWFKLQSKNISTANDGMKFIHLVLQRTDMRIAKNASVSVSFIFAGIYWPLIYQRMQHYQQSGKGVSRYTALERAMDDYASDVHMGRKVWDDMRDIWFMQLHLEKRHPKDAYHSLEHPRFRAVFDFLELRAIVQEEPHLTELHAWWEVFQEPDADKTRLLEEARHIDAQYKKRSGQRRRRAKSAPKVDE